MSEISEVIVEVESLKEKIRHDLRDLSKKFELLSHLLIKDEAPGILSLRCKGHMRLASAMMNGIQSLRLDLILAFLEEKESPETEEVESKQS